MKLRAFTIPLLIKSSVVFAASDSPLLDMEFEELMEKPFVSIATGSLLPIQKAAAVATVITADDIEAIGATDLDQVLETVPGLHVSNTFSNYNPIYSFRGIYSQSNAEALLLLNGIPMTSLYRGDRGGIWGGMPVRSIARIEIIRGPGSAIYGADAFSGVINIITKKAEDIPEEQAGLGYGSFNTKDAWLLGSTRVSDIEVAFTAEFRDTDGPRETIPVDNQTLRDIQDGTNASHAPGPTELSRRLTDFHLDLSRKEWRFQAAYQGRNNVGHGAGFGESLDPEGRYESTRYTLDLQYADPKFRENWELVTTLSLHHIDQQAETDTHLVPAGAVLNSPPFVVPLPNGLIGNPEVWETNKRLDIATFYTGLEQHRIRIGTGYYYGDIYRVRETKNFDLSFAPLPEVVDFSGTDQAFIPTGDRENFYISVQDEWSISQGWSVTSGVRYDRYSDFGDTVNPRVALVWDTTERITTKLLYGRAFRAPSFSELFSVNPIAQGNPELKPETINTYEIAVSVRATPLFHYDLNLFHYDARELINYQFSSGVYIAKNEGHQEANGGEIEFRYQWSGDILLTGNYSFVTASDKSSNEDIGNSPSHQAYARMEWKFLPEWSIAPQVLYVGTRARSMGDDRSALGGHTVVDVTLRRRNVFNKLDAMIAVRNLFDEEVREPASANIPNDLPKSGINVYGSISYRF